MIMIVKETCPIMDKKFLLDINSYNWKTKF